MPTLLCIVFLFENDAFVIEETFDIVSSSCFSDCVFDFLLLLCIYIMLGIVVIASVWSILVLCEGILICISCFDG